MKKHLFLLLAGSSLALSGCATSPHADKWEYKTVRVKYDKTEEMPLDPPSAGVVNDDKTLNAMAKEGWFIAGYNIDQVGQQWFLLKRRVH